VNANRLWVLFIGVVALIGLAVPALATDDGVAPYNQALGQWTSDYLIATLDLTVQIGQNTPAAYSMKLWAKGTQTASTVIVAADVDFLLGLAMLQQGHQVTAWWPTLGRAKTFNSSQTEQEVGLGGGWLEEVAQNPDEYEAVALSEDEAHWTVALHPLADAPPFDHGVVTLSKADGTITGADFYDTANQLLEQDRIDEYSELVDAAGKTIAYPMKMTIYDVAQDKTTTVAYSDVSFPDTLDDSLFTLETLKDLSAKALAGEL
jgi:hypothetical protein